MSNPSTGKRDIAGVTSVGLDPRPAPSDPIAASRPLDDPITFEVIHNALRSVVDEMGTLVSTVAFSLVVSEGRDFSGSICNARGDLIATGRHDQPAHIGTIPYMLKGLEDWLGEDPATYFKPGDLFFANDPFIGGTHNNDIRVCMPVFWEGELVAYVQGSAHWADIGSPVPGSFNTNARDSYGEGVVVPPTKIVDEGVLRRDVVRLLMRNLRDAPTAYGDLMAQIGGCRIGEARVQELIAKYGKDTILEHMDALLDYSERHLREEFANIPDGTYSWTAYLDGDPGTDVDEALPVHLDMTITGDRATYDFSKSAEQAKGAINATIASSVTAAWVATKLIFPQVPLNQGIYRAIDFNLPSRKVLTAEYPAPVSGMASTVFPAVTDCVLACFMQIAPERCMAGPTGHTNSVIGGFDPRPGRERPYVVYMWQEGGWGARVAHKDNHTTMASYAAGAKNQPIELVELYFPLLFERYEYRQDSAGAGYHRGGLGVSKGWSLTHGDALLSVLGDGEDFAPWGWDGGKDGANCVYWMDPDTEDADRISLFTAGRPIVAGQTMRIHREGGGGYGDPLSRPIEWVLADVADELVSVAAARDDYGVVITAVDPVSRECIVDAGATQRLRGSAKPPDAVARR